MKVAIIGHSETIMQIRSIIDFEALFMTAEDFPCGYKKLVPLVEELQKSFDAILFTGIRYFLNASRFVTPTIPWGYPKRSVNAVLCTLLQAQRAGNDISRMTVDLYTITSPQLNQLLHEGVGLPIKDINVYCYNDTAAYKKVVNQSGHTNDYTKDACAYHLANLNSGRADICLSGSAGVAFNESLKGYPVFFVPLTDEDVASALNDLRIQCQIGNWYREQNVVIAVVALALQVDLNVDEQEAAQMYTAHQIEEEIFLYAQNIGAVVEKQVGGEFLIYTTQSELYLITENLNKFALAHELQHLPGVTSVAIGIGFGHSHRVARKNALYSCRCAKRQEYSCYYVMNEHEKLSGPFILRQLKREQQYFDNLTERIASESGTRIAVINQLMKYQKQYGNKPITTEDLSKICHLATSSTNRILAKLIQAGYADVMGSRSQNEKGRPKRLIRLKLPVL